MSEGTRFIGVRLPRDLWRKLFADSKERGLSITEIIIGALRRWYGV